MTQVSLKKYKSNNRISSFVITIKDNFRWKGDFYLDIEEAKMLFKLLKKELKTK